MSSILYQECGRYLIVRQWHNLAAQPVLPNSLNCHTFIVRNLRIISNFVSTISTMWFITEIYEISNCKKWHNLAVQPALTISSNPWWNMISTVKCKPWGKEGQFIDMKRHIEANHVTQTTHTFDLCGKIFMSRNGLRHHKVRNHFT